jgi:hypothetical protein
MRRLTGGHLRTAWRLRQRLSCGGPRMRWRRGSWQPWSGRWARRRRDWHPRPNTGCCGSAGRRRWLRWRLREQRLPRTRQNLARAGCRRRNRPRRRRNRTQRRARRNERQTRRRRRRSRGTRTNRRMNRRSASKHRRPQRNGARLVIFGGSFLLRRWPLLLRSGSHARGRSYMRSLGLTCALLTACRRRGRSSGSVASPRISLLCHFRRRFGSPNFIRPSRRLPGDNRGVDNGCVTSKIAAQLDGVVVVDRAGMGQRLGDTELVQFIDDLTRLHFELPRQLIDSDLTHV